MLPWPDFGVLPYKDDPGMPIQGNLFCNPSIWKENFQYLVKIGAYRQTSNETLQKLHGRNVSQVLGFEMSQDQPSSMLIAWYPEINNVPQGGTATAIKLAKHHKIPVLNLFRTEDRERIERQIRQP